MAELGKGPGGRHDPEPLEGCSAGAEELGGGRGPELGRMVPQAGGDFEVLGSSQLATMGRGFFVGLKQLEQRCGQRRVLETLILPLSLALASPFLSFFLSSRMGWGLPGGPEVMETCPWEAHEGQ